MKNSVFTCPIVEDDDGELCIEFSDEVMESLDLKVGDVLEWIDLKDGSWQLIKSGEKSE